MMEFKGILKKEIFAGDSGYLIAAVEDIEHDEEVLIVGYVKLLKNQLYTFSGEIKEHEKYGEQFVVTKYKLQVPEQGEEIIEFLASKSFEGIGKRTAKKIVDLYEEHTIEMLKTSPQEIIEATNIKEALIYELHEKLNQLDGMDILYKVIAPLNFSEFYINEIFQYLQVNKITNVEKFLKETPYKLVEEIESINFDKADQIYLYYNNNERDEYRLQSALMNEINLMCFNSGDTYVDIQKLQLSLEKRLSLKLENYEEIIEQLTQSNKVIIIDNNLMLNDYYLSEKQIASNILNRLEYLELGLNKEVISQEITNIEGQTKLNYSPLQKEAIINSLSNNISIITGGPGTGKTTIIDAVVKIFRKLKYGNEIIKDISTKIMLCAPTGRAAQRMKETTAFEAKTIHSLLEWDPYKNEFNRSSQNPLIQDLIIIDEFSMVDIFLASAIFRAIKPSALVVIVGDSAQLESVNPGNVLHDLIKTKKIPLIHLDTIFRQGDGSSIALFAKNIDQGVQIEYVNTHDMSLIDRKTNLPQIIKTVIEKSYANGYQEMEVQVLYPKYSGANGINKINETLLPNKENKYIEAYETKFYLNDKVMQLKNNYDKDIFNGDIGTITHIYNAKKPIDLALEVTFKEKKVNLLKKELIDLKHAYAISIHKSQGSEFKVVILPIAKESERMLNKKLIYTGITRAKDKLIVIGDMECFKERLMIEEVERKTYLQQIFKKFID
ncbi:MAG: ATP-dependent RecD-like DNA helicase [Mycoplasmatales bacterium]